MTADEEEQRHDLEQPRHQEQTVGETDRVGGMRPVGLPQQDREDPVPADHHQQADGAHEVDENIAPLVSHNERLCQQSESWLLSGLSHRDLHRQVHWVGCLSID